MGEAVHVWGQEKEGNSALPTQFCCKPKTACHAVPSHRVQLFATLWTAACQAPLSMGFSKQECWSGLPFPSPGDLPNPGIEPKSPALQADALPSEPPGKPHKETSNTVS